MNSLYNAAPYCLACKVLYKVFESVNADLFTTYAVLDAGKKCYWTQNMVTSCAAVVMCCMAVKTIMEVGLDDFWATSSFGKETFRFYLGYIWADTDVMLHNWNSWPAPRITFMHHAVTVVGCAMLDARPAAHGFTALILLGEITTPFLTQLYFFAESGMKSSPLYGLSGIAVVVLWVPFRILSIGWVLRRLIQIRPALPSIDVYIGCLSAVYVLQWYWLYRLVMGVAKHYKKRA
jgi:hypothetical protein